jgi:hypothetical protein
LYRSVFGIAGPRQHLWSEGSPILYDWYSSASRRNSSG